MRVARLSLTVLKGAAHAQPDTLALDASGPRDDRRFCLVDPSKARVLRTVENPRLVGCRASFDGTDLTVRLPDGQAVGAPVVGGAPVTADYWGRAAALTLVDGPWGELMSSYLGRQVVLAQVASAGQVVFGGAVTLLTTSSLRELARRLNADDDEAALLADSERFRSTVVIDTGDLPPFVEDGWARVRLGDVALRVRGAVPRCAVVRIAPGHGVVQALDPLRALAPDRTELNERGREVVFGVDADVEAPGVVRLGDDVQPS